MVFKAFFKPKWQHKNPDVRRQAVQALDSADASAHAILAQIARTDGDLQVRRAALKRLRDLDVLGDVARADDDAEVRADASQRLAQLLAGGDAAAPPLEERMQRLTGTTDSTLIEHLARHGAERELRLAALQRVSREALLGDVALNDADGDVRVAAVERITQKSTLERVAKQARTKDKRVSAAARGKLEHMAAAAERPVRLQQQARQACVALEALVQSKDWSNADARVAQIENDWNGVLREWDAAALGAFDAALTERRARARAAFERRYAEQAQTLAQQRAEGAQRDYLRAQKRAVCEQLERQADELKTQSAPAANDEHELPALLDMVRNAWREIGALPDAMEREWQERFGRATAAIESYVRDIARFRAAATALADVHERADALAAAEQPPSPRELNAIEARLREISFPGRFVGDAAAHAAVVEALAQMRRRHEQRAERVQAALNQFRDHVQELEAALQAGQSQVAFDVQRKTQTLLDALDAADAAPLRKDGAHRRWQAANKQLRQLAGWKRWAGAPVKERLVEEMEALAREIQAVTGAPPNYPDVANQIRRAREEWKRLGATDNPEAKALWERFDAACTAAHAPCAEFFAHEREQRAEHAQQKETICRGLEDFIAQTAWEHVDWKQVERMLRGARMEWQRVGPVEHAQHNALNKRFRALMDDLGQRVHAERQRNKLKKEGLIRRMQQLAETVKDAAVDSAPFADAIAQVKQMQAQWKEIGPSAAPQQLWNAFRAASDAIFARRQALHAAQDEERRGNLQRRQELCELVEGLAQLEGDALAQARGRVQQAKNDFERAGPVPREVEKEVTQRFRRACQQFERQLARQRRREQAAQEQLLERKVRLCAELEQAADAVLNGTTSTDAAAELARATQGTWQGLASLPDAWETGITARFQLAVETLYGLHGPQRDTTAAALRKRQQENIARRELLCLRLEIATGAESPPEFRQQRMQYQVDQLAQRMRSGSFGSDADRQPAVQAIVHEWNFAGPVPVEHARRLSERFEHARATSVARRGDVSVVEDAQE